MGRTLEERINDLRFRIFLLHGGDHLSPLRLNGFISPPVHSLRYKSNLELTRNHIIWFYRQLAELIDGIQFDLFSEAGFDPERYGLRPLPPEYPSNWMCPTGDYPDRLAWKQ